MTGRIGRAIAIGLVAVVAGATVAVATQPSGLSSKLLARGSWDKRERTAFIAGVAKLRRGGTSDVAVVGGPVGVDQPATLQPGGTTGWHTHPGPSVVVLRSGTLQITEATEDGCEVVEYNAATGAKAFFHTDDLHKFDNPGSTVAEFYIIYFAPTGAPLADFSPPEPDCSGDDDSDDDD